MAKRTRYHHTFLHHSYERRDPRIDEWVVECTGCSFLAKGFTRKPDARKVADQHEKEANHG
jgi:hypothetical protein